MERRINKKIEIYLAELKENIRKKISEIDESDSNLHKMLEYIYDYDRLSLSKEDFMKRKRVKNIVHLSDRCCAKRANGDQCTRRRKEDTTEFCGTHLKGTPHGVCSSDDESKPEGKKIEVWAQDIQGIVYYIDKASNVYQIEDIMEGKSNPKIIAKYLKVGETYVIPEFNMN
jgi:hypothetical protein